MACARRASLRVMPGGVPPPDPLMQLSPEPSGLRRTRLRPARALRLPPPLRGCAAYSLALRAKALRLLRSCQEVRHSPMARAYTLGAGAASPDPADRKRSVSDVGSESQIRIILVDTDLTRLRRACGLLGGCPPKPQLLTLRGHLRCARGAACPPNPLRIF